MKVPWEAKSKALLQPIPTNLPLLPCSEGHVSYLYITLTFFALSNEPFFLCLHILQMFFHGISSIYFYLVSFCVNSTSFYALAFLILSL